MEAIVGEAEVHCHLGIVLGSFLNFEEAFPDVWKGSFKFAFEIAGDDDPHIIFFYNVQDVVLLVDLRQFLELAPS